MSRILFDDHARRLRRDRALRIRGDRFLNDRAFDDCLDRLTGINGSFSTVVIAGLADPRWPRALAAIGAEVVLADDGPLTPGNFDLCLSIGDLESANDVQAAAFALRHLLRPGGLLLGAIVGGNSLPRLRAAMLAADRDAGTITPRFHPAIDGPSLAALLTSVGFVEPVIDVDRVEVRYTSLGRLIDDLRAMACTNILTDRSRRPMTRAALAVASRHFLGGAADAVERFELLHFAAWAPRI
jgi:hypothetical protein